MRRYLVIVEKTSTGIQHIRRTFLDASQPHQPVRQLKNGSGRRFNFILRAFAKKATRLPSRAAILPMWMCPHNTRSYL